MQSQTTYRSVHVFANWQGFSQPAKIGVLHSELLRGKEVFSFEYAKEWLSIKHSIIIDPDLELYEGLHFADNARYNFGVFLDSSPDRWGRVLMRRREAVMARIEGRKPNKLFETDYLLGVYDEYRLGGIRYKQNLDGVFENNDKNLASPPWTSIGTLEQISLDIESDNYDSDQEHIKWLNILLAPGSSLGGARPKANVSDNKNRLWIAKFPSISDSFDVGAWELLTHKLAIFGGVQMASCQVKKFSGRHHTFLTKRFDRAENGERIHFASAMTMLGYTDGQEGASYLDLAEFITNYGCNVTADLEQLWTRIVFNICVANTDDHLRNHGFILTKNGWRLSPAYDLNPNENGLGLSLNIDSHDNALELELALSVIPYFRLKEKRAIEIISKVKSAVGQWRKEAKIIGLSKLECDLKASAFKVP